MGGAKTANADRSATLTNSLPLAIPSFSLTFRLYALVATFFDAATGIPSDIKANRRNYTPRLLPLLLRYLLNFQSICLAIYRRLEMVNKIIEKNYEETANTRKN